MLPRSVVTAVLVGLATAGQAAAQTRVELVVESSGSMWQRLADQSFHFAAVRQAILALVDRLPEADPSLEVGLRLAGGRFDLTLPAACAPTPAEVPLAPVDRARLREALLAIRPQGEAPLATVIEAAAAELGGAGERRLVVVITDGWDSCGGDLDGALERLAGGNGSVELRVVGVGLDERLVERYLAHAPVANGRDYAGLVAALDCALDGIVATPAPAELEVVVEVERWGGPVDDALIELVDPLSSVVQPMRFEDGAYRARVAAGVYALLVEDAVERRQTWVDLHVVAGGDNRFVVELVAPEEVRLEVVPMPAPAGSEVSVLFDAAPLGEGFVSAVPAGVPDQLYGELESVDGGSGQVSLGTADGALSFEARYYLRQPSGVGRVVGRASFVTRQTAATVEAGGVVYTERPFPVAWQGPDNACDHVALVAGDGTDDERLSWARVENGSPLELVAPQEPGSYELRYLSGVSGRWVARLALEIREPEATLEGPTEVPAASRFEVRWTGPDAAGDHVLVVGAGAPTGRYLSFAYTAGGNPLALQAPAEPGDYEVRYASGEKDRVLWTIPLTVTAIPVRLEAPLAVSAGARFSVRWSGPARPGDFLTVVPRSAPPRVFSDWGYTNEGNPLSLAAPEKPGEYEVRYVSGEDKKVLATVPVVVK